MLCGCAWIRPPFVAPDILLSLLNFNTTDLKAHKFNQTMCLCLTNNGTVGNLQLNCYSANYGHGRFALPLSTIDKLLEVLHFLIAWVVNGKWTFISRSLFAFFFLPTYWISSVHAPSNASNKNKNGEKAARHKQEIRKDNNKENLSSNQWPSLYWMTHSAPELQPPTGVECGPTAHLCPGAASLFNLASVFLLLLEERIWISLPPLPLYENDLHHTVTGAASVLRHRHCNRKMKSHYIFIFVSQLYTQCMLVFLTIYITFVKYYIMSPI